MLAETSGAGAPLFPHCGAAHGASGGPRHPPECHRRVGRVGPEYQSSRRARGRGGAAPATPLSGAASATWEHVHRHFAVAALLSPTTPPIPLAGQRSMRMSISLRRPQRSPQGSASFSESKRLREIPHWCRLVDRDAKSDETDRFRVVSRHSNRRATARGGTAKGCLGHCYLGRADIRGGWGAAHPLLTAVSVLSGGWIHYKAYYTLSCA